MNKEYKQLAIAWLLENRIVAEGNITFRDRIKEFFDVYNTLTDQNKEITTCGRCINNMKTRLRVELKHIDKMTKYKVYRTDKGNLSFKENGESIFTVHASTKLMADEALRNLKSLEKRENIKIEDK